MKIIDLLNKIANGEEVPKKIKHKMIEGNTVEELLDNLKYIYGVFNDSYYKALNSEIEIIEENKKIEKLEYSNGGLTLHYGKDDYAIVNHEKIIINKINELIDEVNKLKGE